MSTIVGTNIEVTNIKFDSDTTSMIISNAGQVSVKSEGQAITTVKLQQGIIKQWLYLDHVNATIKSSLNTSSFTDTNNGRGDFNLTSAFTSVNDYGANYTGNAYNGNSWNTNTANVKMNWNSTNTTTKYDFASYSDGVSAYLDSLYAYSLAFGDLA